MKKKFLLSLRLCYLVVSIGILLTAVFGLAGCGSGSEKNEPFEWLNLTIKFKDSTDEATRDAALSAIRDNLIDTIRQIQKEHKDFTPTISTELVSISDPLSYHVVVQNAMPVLSMTNCLCKTDCRICQSAFLLIVPHRESPEFEISKVINTLNTDFGVKEKK